MTNWEAELQAMREALPNPSPPSLDRIAAQSPNSWSILIATIISLRTRDELTLEAAKRLLAQAPRPQALLNLGEDGVSRLIYPAGFYRTKAKNMMRIAEIIIGAHAGRVPANQDALMALPGVGLKTANLVLGLAFGIPALCVDIHVHRIANRRGWISTAAPDESEAALCRILPQELWINLNPLLVSFGQQICTPVSPRCSQCPLNCPAVGVKTHR